MVSCIESYLCASECSSKLICLTLSTQVANDILKDSSCLSLSCFFFFLPEVFSLLGRKFRITVSPLKSDNSTFVILNICAKSLPVPFHIPVPFLFYTFPSRGIKCTAAG